MYFAVILTRVSVRYPISRPSSLGHGPQSYFGSMLRHFEEAHLAGLARSKNREGYDSICPMY